MLRSGVEAPPGRKRSNFWKGWLFKDQAARVVQQANAELERSLVTQF
jgi:hypothetical protein